MLRITSRKIAQLIPERYEGEHSDQQFDYARDEAESAHSEMYNVYLVKETYADGSEHISDDGYASAEEAKQIAMSGLEDFIGGGAIRIDVIHRDEGWVETVWSRDTEPTQPMPQPMAQPMPKPMQVPFPR